MKTTLHILLVLLFNVLFVGCTEDGKSSASRAKYCKEAHVAIENFYTLIWESVGDMDKRNTIIERLVYDKNASTFKADFLPDVDESITFCNPQQYFMKFEIVYGSMADDAVFIVDNFGDGEIMDSPVGCYIPVEYDLTLERDGEVLFKRRCLMCCIFPDIRRHRLVKIMQVEPVFKNGLSSKGGSRGQVSAALPNGYGKKAETETYSSIDWTFVLYPLGILLLAVCILYGLYLLFKSIGRSKTLSSDAEKYYQKGKIAYDQKKYEAAIEWLAKSAIRGYAPAQCKLGVCYYNGYGVSQSWESAVEWCSKSAAQGYAQAQYNLGTCYENGRGVPQSWESAVVWYRKSAEQGFAPAQCKLGVCYYNGYSVSQSWESAVEWYRKSAEQGYAPAQYNLGVCYENGRGVPQSWESAVEWWRKSAEQGHAIAQYNLSVCHYNGRGVAQSYENAVEWYHKSAAQGHALAQNNLGVCYENGRGVPKSYETAFIWYHKSAVQGHALAQYNLSICYYNGHGVSQSCESAVEWCSKSAAQGYAAAQYNLGACYENGQGVQKSRQTAIEWYTKAAEQGHADAKKRLETLNK